MESEPALAYLDEEACARRLHYDRPVEASLQAFVAARLANAELLERLDEDAWQGKGVDGAGKPISVEEWLRGTTEHAHDHAAQLLRAAGRDVI